MQTYTENSCAPSIVSDPRFSRRKKDGELTENSGSPTSPFTALHRGVLQACRSRPDGKYGMSYTRRAAFIGTYLEQSADSPPSAGVSPLRCRLRIPWFKLDVIRMYLHTRMNARTGRRRYARVLSPTRCFPATARASDSSCSLSMVRSKDVANAGSSAFASAAELAAVHTG